MRRLGRGKAVLVMTLQSIFEGLKQLRTSVIVIGTISGLGLVVGLVRHRPAAVLILGLLFLASVLAALHEWCWNRRRQRP